MAWAPGQVLPDSFTSLFVSVINVFAAAYQHCSPVLVSGFCMANFRVKYLQKMKLYDQCIHEGGDRQTDRQTDGRTTYHSIATLCRASRGKNITIQESCAIAKMTARCALYK